MDHLDKQHKHTIEHDRWKFGPVGSDLLIAGVAERVCVLCGKQALWRWDRLTPAGRIVEQILLCGRHESELRVSEENARSIHGRSGVGTFPRILTRDDVWQFIGFLHWIPAAKGLKAESHKRFNEYERGSLLTVLRGIGAVCRGDGRLGSIGWKARATLSHVVLLSDRVWVARFVRRGSLGLFRERHLDERAQQSTPFA